jgi:2-polyprenyl-6-methoxyphenol hydroxylase-like FAD-dependent oxidoreductase
VTSPIATSSGPRSAERPAEQTDDVIIVGARCAGSSLAAELASAGLRVTVLERATFPRDTLSSHTIQSDVLAYFNRLGILDAVRATGAVFTSQVDTRLGDVRFGADWPREPGDVGGAANIRRHVLDPILAAAASRAGARLRMNAKVVGLVREGDRVVGVRVREGAGDGPVTTLRARLVVGADGRDSTVARAVGARSYHVTANERAYYWTFYAGADPGPAPTFVFHRWADRFILGGPSDGGLYFVGVSPELAQLDEFRHDLEPSFRAHALDCAPVAAAVAGARRATRIFGIARFSTYFRDAGGPGWVLLGDAGHFKDPAGGRGMGDAFLQAQALAAAITAADDPSAWDAAVAGWGRWRDREFLDDYWMAHDLGRAGSVPLVVPALVRRLHATEGTGRFLGLLSHRTSPNEVLSVPRVLATAGRLLVDREADRPRLLRELGGLAGDKARREWRRRRPSFAG